MSLNLKGYRISLIFVPADMRCGFAGLSVLANRFAHINVNQGEDCVIFVSKSRTILKAIWADEKGSYLLNRRLNEGRFQQILARVDAGEKMLLTKDLLLKYLDGGEIQTARTDYFQGI